MVGGDGKIPFWTLFMVYVPTIIDSIMTAVV